MRILFRAGLLFLLFVIALKLIKFLVIKLFFTACFVFAIAFAAYVVYSLVKRPT